MISMSIFKLDDIILIAIIILIIFLLIFKHRSVRLGNEDHRELGVGSLIEKVRTELRQAEEERMKKDSAAFFKVETFDLEINFVIKTSESGNANFQLEPVTIGGQQEVSTEKVQKIILHMSAIEPAKYMESVVEKKSSDGQKVLEYGQRPPDKEGNQK